MNNWGVKGGGKFHGGGGGAGEKILGGERGGNDLRRVKGGKDLRGKGRKIVGGGKVGKRRKIQWEKSNGIIPMAMRNIQRNTSNAKNIKGHN